MSLLKIFKDLKQLTKDIHSGDYKIYYCTFI